MSVQNKRDKYVSISASIILILVGLIYVACYFPKKTNTIFQIINDFHGNTLASLNASINHDKYILSNQSSLNNILNQYKYYSDISFPTFDQFKQQLFCPTINEDPNDFILELIYKNQFKQNCYDKDVKFLVHDISLDPSGIGSFLNAFVSEIFWKAMALNRTYLMIGNWKWSNGYTYCQNKKATECYTLPVSNCNYSALIKHYKPKHLNPLEATNKTYLMESDDNILVCYLRCYRSGLNRDMILEWFNNEYNRSINIYNVEGILFSYIFRINYQVRSLVFKNIKEIYINDIYPNNYSNIVGWVLRGSDKCDRETICWSLNDYKHVLQGLYYINNEYNTFLISSEDHDLLLNIINNTYQENFNFIYFKNDTFMNGGSFRGIIYKNNSDWNENVIVKSLTIFMLQLVFSKTIMLNRNSGWARYIMYGMNTLQCKSLFYSNINDNNINPHIPCMEIVQHGGNTPRFEKPKTLVVNSDLFGKITNETFYKKFNVFLDEDRICGSYDMSKFHPAIGMK